MSAPKSFWQRALAYPPVLVRLLARKRYGPPLTDQEIAERSGLSTFQVQAISQQTSWAGVDVLVMHRFLVGCGVDFENSQSMARVDTYMQKKPTWKYLRVSPDWLFYQSLILRYRRAILSPQNER